MPIRIDFISNVRDLLRGTKSVEDAFDDVADSLDDVARDGDQSLGRLEDSFSELARKARSTKNDVQDVGQKGFRAAGDASSEFKSEALSNLSEVTSSFDGSMESIGELVQGTLGGVAANIPIVGLAAAGAAAAVGTITEAFIKADEATKEARDSAYEYGLTVAGAGQFADAASRINELTGSVEGLQRVQDIATVSGWKQKEVLAALATGDGLPALAEAFNDGANSTTVAIGRLVELQGSLDGAAQGFSLASEGAQLNARALYDLANQAGTATGEVDDLGNAVVTMPDGKQIVIDAETRTAYEDVDAFEKSIPPVIETTVRVRRDSREWDNWQPNPKTGVIMAQRPRTIPGWE